MCPGTPRTHRLAAGQLVGAATALPVTLPPPPAHRRLFVVRRGRGGGGRNSGRSRAGSRPRRRGGQHVAISGALPVTRAFGWPSRSPCVRVGARRGGSRGCADGRRDVARRVRVARLVEEQVRPGGDHDHDHESRPRRSGRTACRGLRRSGDVGAGPVFRPRSGPSRALRARTAGRRAGVIPRIRRAGGGPRLFAGPGIPGGPGGRPRSLTGARGVAGARDPRGGRRSPAGPGPPGGHPARVAGSRAPGPWPAERGSPGGPGSPAGPRGPLGRSPWTGGVTRSWRPESAAEA